MRVIIQRFRTLVKLNSKSHLVKTAQRDPISQALWDMDDVMSLVHNGINVVGIGYTVYIGSEYEHEMLTEAAHFIRQAHELGMISVVWMYPRGQAVGDEKDPQLHLGGCWCSQLHRCRFRQGELPQGL